MEPSRNRPRFDLPPEAADPPEAERRRAVRDVPALALRRAEAVLARRGRDAHPAPRRDHRAVVAVRRPRDRHGHAAPRPAERPGQHPEQAVRDDLRRVRGEPARDGRRRRRREVPPRLLGRPRHGRQAHDPPLADAQPEPPGGGQPRRRGPDAGQAAAVQGPRPQARHPDPDPRRRRLRRPGARGRDAQPVATAGLPHRRHDPHRRQQPDRLHDRARATPGRPATAPTSPR